MTHTTRTLKYKELAKERKNNSEIQFQALILMPFIIFALILGTGDASATYVLRHYDWNTQNEIRNAYGNFYFYGVISFAVICAVTYFVKLIKASSQPD